jgi:putative flippase GtrA
MIRRIMSFVLAGAAAFVVDASVLAAGVEILALDPMWARAASFSCALTVSYILNRWITFQDRPAHQRSAVLYVVCSLASAILNFGLYALTVNLSSSALAPYAGLLIGVGSGMILNFTLYNVLVFPGTDPEK